MARALLLAVALLLAGGCGGSGGGAQREGVLRALEDVDDVARAFDADAGRPRLVLLLSPT